MIDDMGVAEILLRGLYDAVSLAEVRSLIGFADPSDVLHLEREPVALRDASLAAIAFLLEHRLMEVGDLVVVEPATPAPGAPKRPPPVRFEPWPVDGETALTRIAREWWDPERDLDPGNICWLQNTPAGDEAARQIEAARGS
ncbi:hypothetical protein [Actinomycetospora flava]|uniref:Uncharacterized protein n=1 Tax=Actinomycetospora flava TaxID=3129232 RepID=A0ABU8M634_9PSEU